MGIAKARKTEYKAKMLFTLSFFMFKNKIAHSSFLSSLDTIEVQKGGA